MKKRLLFLVALAILIPAVIATTIIVSNNPIDKNDPEFYYMTGNAFAIKDEYWPAVEQYKKALSLDPLNEKAMNNLAFMLNKLGKYAQAALELEKLIGINPENPSYHYDYAINLVLEIKKTGQGKIEDIEKAIEELRKADQLEPGFKNVDENIAFLEGLKSQYYSKN
ncbi:tetratricopeptide repeat protein [Candidatus Woesearchaeota archaeon]|nr:tetratricopeptide repeat protein [Candidatus Woesearchaeota archaeon]